jgi:hypothetical protein
MLRGGEKGRKNSRELPEKESGGWEGISTGKGWSEKSEIRRQKSEWGRNDLELGT